MDDIRRIERIENKVDKLGDRLSSIDSTLAAQHESLKIHIHRTELLEKRSDHLEAYINKTQGALRLLSASGVIILLLKYLTKILD